MLSQSLHTRLSDRRREPKEWLRKLLTGFEPKKEVGCTKKWNEKKLVLKHTPDVVDECKGPHDSSTSDDQFVSPFTSKNQASVTERLTKSP